MSNELANTQQSLMPSGGVFGSTESFELAQRQATMLCSSDLVPKAFQGKDKIGNCVIALELASRVGASPFMVMQNLDVIHGKPGWSSKYLIGTFNACGRFAAITYEEDDKNGGRTRAVSSEIESGKAIHGPWISMEMAKAEGWSTKNGSKWITMPELMRRYRAAAFMIRTVAPEISLGLHTKEEIVDTDGLRNVTPRRVEVTVDPGPALNAIEEKIDVEPEFEGSAPSDDQDAQLADIAGALQDSGIDFDDFDKMLREAKLLKAKGKLVDADAKTVALVHSKLEELIKVAV